MTPLPGPLGRGDVLAWRLDQKTFAGSWDSWEGAFLYGGRWNSPGVRAVYCSIDPATAILEVAVHKTFRVLDTVPHVLTALRIRDPLSIHVVEPVDVPNPTRDSNRSVTHCCAHTRSFSFRALCPRTAGTCCLTRMSRRAVILWSARSRSRWTPSYTHQSRPESPDIDNALVSMIQTFTDDPEER